VALRVLVAATAGVVLAGTLAAQRVERSVDVSGTGIWYADSIHAAGSSLNPAVRVDWSSATLGAFASVSRVGGGVSAQGMLTPSVFTPSVGPFSGELAASLGGSTHPDGTRTGQTLAVARGYASRANLGAWIGAGAGATWDGAVWRRVRQSEAGAWRQWNGITSLATVTPVVVADSIRYTDIQAALRYAKQSLELGVTLGTRAGSVGPAIGGASRAWGSVSAVAWLTSSVAIVASGGSYPVDLTQGYPGGRFVTIALRIASHGSRSSERAPDTRRSPITTTALENAPAAEATNLQTVTISGTRRTLRLVASSARTVEINADFTQWRPVALSRAADGSWAVTLPIAAGTHQMNIRIDGGAWTVPSGMLTMADEFGGVVGILRFE
jgi:hypothetical protein